MKYDNGKIKFEGKNSKNPFAFHYYDAERVIGGKKMKDHLKFAMSYWHTRNACGTDMFGGDNSLANIVAMNGKLNKGEYKAMELTWQRALQEGKNVTVNGELIFSGNSQRPDKIIVKYIIENGDEVVKTFLN